MRVIFAITEKEPYIDIPASEFYPFKLLGEMAGRDCLVWWARVSKSAIRILERMKPISVVECVIERRRRKRRAYSGSTYITREG